MARGLYAFECKTVADFTVTEQYVTAADCTFYVTEKFTALGFNYNFVADFKRAVERGVLVPVGHYKHCASFGNLAVNYAFADFLNYALRLKAEGNVAVALDYILGCGNGGMYLRRFSEVCGQEIHAVDGWVFVYVGYGVFVLPFANHNYVVYTADKCVSFFVKADCGRAAVG